MEISVGQIWKVVKKGFTVECKEAHTCSCGHEHDRTIIKEIPRNSFIEIRYPFKWHFRTEKNTYHHKTEEEIINKCILFANIDEQTRWCNNHDLKEILEQKLYSEIDK